MKAWFDKPEKRSSEKPDPARWTDNNGKAMPPEPKCTCTRCLATKSRKEEDLLDSEHDSDLNRQQNVRSKGTEKEHQDSDPDKVV